MQLTIRLRTAILSLLAALFLGGVIAGSAFFAGVSAREHSTAVATPAFVQDSPAPANPAVSAPAAKSADLAAPSAELIPGTGPESGTDKGSYRCKAGFTPITVPVGKTVQAGGATYSLTQAMEYDTQRSVTASIKLPKGVAAPSLYINTTVHLDNRSVAPEHLLNVGILPGGTGNYTWGTDIYAGAYNKIVDYTVCAG